MDTTLKQRYASQLSDHNNSINSQKDSAETDAQITFTQFCNELARVLGTRQHAATKASVKTVMAASAETESEEEGVMTKSQTKKDGKINAQSSQIKDLCTKLDQAVAENSQIREFLSQLLCRRHLQVPCRLPRQYPNRQGLMAKENNPFWVNTGNPSSSAGIDGTTDPEKSCRYCKDMGHELRNCLRLQAREAFLARQQQLNSGLN